MRLSDALGAALTCAALACAVPGSGSAAAAQLRDYRSPAISAGGERIAAIEAEAAAPGQRPHARIVVRDALQGRVLAEYDPCAACSYDFPSWSPDRSSLAFIAADAAAGSATLWVVRGGRPQAAATIRGVANTARWSPDGARIALLATIGAKKQTGAVEAGERLVGEIGVNEDAQRIAVVPAQGGEARLVSPADTSAGGRWSGSRST